MVEVFKLIQLLGTIKNEKLIVDLNDEKEISKYYKLSNKTKKVKYNTYRNMVINYRIENMEDVETSCIDVLKSM